VIFKDITSDQAKDICMLYASLEHLNSGSPAIRKIAKSTINKLVEDPKVKEFKELFDRSRSVADLKYMECLKLLP